MQNSAIGKGSWLKRRLRQWLDQVEPPDSLVLVVSAVVVGVGTGLGAVVFVRLLEQIRALGLWVQAQLGEAIGLIVVMGAAGLLVGYIVNRWAKEAKGHGVPEVMEAVALRSGRIRPRVAAVKVLASSITIGAGGSAGREGPIVQVGSALGSTLGQFLHFSVDRVRTLVACGAAAGIASTFNAPIAGAIFALEVILGRFTTRYFGAVVISSVTAAIVGRVFLSDRPAFVVPAYPVHHLSEYWVYALLGILAAFVAVLFIRVLYFVEGMFDRWSIHAAWKAGLGMVLTAVVALLLPGRLVLGPGLEFIGEAIAGDFMMPVGVMAALLLGKLLATSFTLGSGNSGGVFAPGLFMGALLGGIVGNVAHTVWPDVVMDPGAYAIVGMAAVFSGAARAPITAVLIVFEMSNDYHLILPLMLASVLSTLLSEYLFRDSIYTLKLRLKGITLQRGRDLDVMQGFTVGEAMTPKPTVVSHSMPLPDLSRVFEQTHSHSFPVVDDDLNLIGMVSIRDYERALERSDWAELTVENIATIGSILVAFTDEPMSDALQRIAIRDVNKLPVVARDNPRRVIGVIRRRDIIKAYNVALARRAEQQVEDDKTRLRRLGDVEFMEMRIADNSRAARKTIAELAPLLPHGCVIVSIRRQETLLFPHGNTVLLPEDLVNAFVRREDEMQLQRCLLAEEGEVQEEEGGGK